MNNRPRFSRRVLLGAAVWTWMEGSRTRRSDAAEPLVLVAAASAPFGGISRSDLRRLYSGDPVSLGGRNLIPFNLPPQHPERQRFDQLVLGMDPTTTSKYWIDRRIRGGSSPPKTAPTPDVLVKVAANLPGAIAYVPAGAINATVKALDIEGVAASDARYLLRGA